MWFRGKEHTCNAEDARDASQTQLSMHTHAYSKVTVSKDMFSF